MSRGKKNGNGAQRRNYNNKRNNNVGVNNKNKEVELNVPTKDLNSADIPVRYKLGGRRDNDWTWYAKNAQILKDAASLPFGNPLGYEVELGIDNTVENSAFVVPGIMTFDVALTPGVSRAANSPINVATQQIYTVDRQANSGATNYDKTDVGLYYMAMDSAYAVYATLVRVYKSMHWFDYLNRYTPRYVVTAQGFDYDNLCANMADFRAMLNMFAYKLASFNVPDEFTFIRRHSWMFSHIYKDAEDNKAQLYMYRLRKYYIWNEGTGDSPTYLASNDFLTEAPLTINDISSILSNIINPLFGSQDVGTLSGDLAKAFNASGMIKLQPISEAETLEPEYSMEVIQQMMNCTRVGNNVLPSSLPITVNYEDTVVGPWIQFAPVLSAVSSDVGSISAMRMRHKLKKILNLKNVEVSPENVIVATRLACAFGEVYTNGNLVQQAILSCGTEIVMRILAHTIDYTNGGALSVSEVYTDIAIDANATVSSVYSRIASMCDESTFDNHPTSYICTYDSTNDLNLVGVFQDIANIPF